MGILYIDTGGATTNSGSSDNNAADLSGTANATVSGSVVTLGGSPDLTNVQTSGASQSTIYLAQATNANRKIFWITAKDNVAKTVTVDTAPTGVTGSDWAIGGRMVWTPANVEAGLRAGDIVQFNNSPASSAATLYTHRIAGNNSAGFITLRGKSGVRPVLTHTSTSNVITTNAIAGLWVENLEIVQQGASGQAVAITSGPTVFYNVKVSDAGATGINVTGGHASIIDCEVSGVADGIAVSTQNAFVIGNYIHDCTSNGVLITSTTTRVQVLNNIIESNSGRGIYVNAAAAANAAMCIIAHNTVYGNGNSGLEVSDADIITAVFGNIFSMNGNASGEANVEWAAGAGEYQSWHGFNCFYHDGSGSASNLLNVTANSTEITTDPQFIDAAGGDFRLKVTSPARGIGFMGGFLGGPTSYADMGAVQRIEPHFNLINGGLAQ